MTTNLFVIASVKQLRTYVVLEFYCLFSKHLGVLAFLTVFTNRVEFGTILEGLRNFGGGIWTPQTPPLGTPLFVHIPASTFMQYEGNTSHPSSVSASRIQMANKIVRFILVVQQLSYLPSPSTMTQVSQEGLTYAILYSVRTPTLVLTLVTTNKINQATALQTNFYKLTTAVSAML